MHLEIPTKTRTPRWELGQPHSTFCQRKKFFAQWRWTQRMLLLPNPLSNLFLQEGADVSELRQGLFPGDQVPCFDIPEKCAACGAAKGALQNIGSLARFQRK